jgi:hypothetical protein
MTRTARQQAHQLHRSTIGCTKIETMQYQVRSTGAQDILPVAAVLHFPYARTLPPHQPLVQPMVTLANPKNRTIASFHHN